MRHLLRPIAAALPFCALLGSCAPVPPPPVCGQPEVLLLLGERLDRAGRGQVIEPGSVNQAPGATPDRLRCAARVRTASYDTNRFGPTPAITVGIVSYGVELRRNGVFLLPDIAGSAPATDPGPAPPRR